MTSILGLDRVPPAARGLGNAGLTTLGRFDWPATRDGGDPNALTAEGSLENPHTPWDAVFEVERPNSGVSVTELNAVNLAAVWRCVTLISGAVARTHLNTYRRLQVGKARATDHYLWPLFRYQANPFMSAYRFKRAMQAWLLLWGNAYAEIEINGRGQVVGLWPWRPDRVRITGLDPDQVIYHYRMNDGSEVALPGAFILHLRGLELDGFAGLNPIRSNKESIGLAKAAEQYGARFFANNGRPGGVIQHPAKLGADARKNIQETYEKLHRGIRGAHRVAILEEGMKYQDVGIAPENMQFLQTRQFQAIDIARLFGVPPHMIAELSRATFNNIEHQSIEFVMYCLDDWFANWEAEIMHSLLSDTEAKQITVEFAIERLLRGDLKARYDAYAVARNWGWLNVNEIRARENMNGIGPAGDVYLQPLNMNRAGEVPQLEPPDDPDDEGDPGTAEEDLPGKPKQIVEPPSAADETAEGEPE